MKPMLTKLLFRALSPAMVTKAMESFDRVAALVVGICWAAAAVMIGFALYTVNMSVSAKHAAEAASAAEPFLPAVARKAVDAKDIQGVIDRLQHRYPDVAFTFKNGLTVTSGDGSKFHEWLSAVDYIDTIMPQVQWSLQEMCVGKCSGRDLMGAVLVGQKAAFSKPQLTEKN